MDGNANDFEVCRVSGILFCLLNAAANQRRKAFELLRKVEPIQKTLF